MGKAFAQLDAWAETIPHECGACGQPHVHAGDLCAVARCAAPLQAGEPVYAVIQHGAPDAPDPVPCQVNPELTTADCGHAEQWVCGRHVRTYAQRAGQGLGHE